jgi:NitT/TauT family transport system substrate-binding protein
MKDFPALSAVRILAIAAVATLGAPTPARADDTLQVITGAQPSAYYQVLDDVAQLGGYYKAEHLIVNVNYAGNPTIAAQLVSSGKGDIGAEAVEPLIIGYERGVRLEAFFSRAQTNEYVLGVNADSPIRRLADFKGQILGEYSVGSSAEDYVNSMLAGAGLSRGDYSYIPIGNGAQAIQALNAHKVAGAAFPVLELLNYQITAGQKYRFFFHPILQYIGDTAYVATPATIQSKADALKRFCRATAKAAILIRENPRLAARWYLEGAGIKVTDDAVDKEVQLLVLAQDMLPGANPTSSRIGAIPPAGMAVLAQAMFENGRTSQPISPALFDTDQFVDYANDFDHKAEIARAKSMR